MHEKDYFNVLTEEYQKGIDIVLSYLLEEVEKINITIDDCDDKDLRKKYKEKKDINY